MTPEAAALPADLADILQQLDLNEREVEVLIRDLGDEQVRWQPSPSEWSMGHCLDHLTASSRVYLEPMRQAASAARQKGKLRRGPIRPGAPSRLFLRILEPPPRRRLRAPRKIEPVSGKGKAQLAEEFNREQQEVRDFVRRTADLDLDRIRFANPFIPFLRFTLGTGLLVLTSHQRRHLWQAERVRQHPAFGTS